MKFSRIIITSLITALLLVGAGCEKKAATNIRQTEPAAPGAKLVTQLNLGASSLTSFPSYVFEMKNLEELDLSNNQLAGELPSDISNLRELRELRLKNNQLTGITEDIGKLRSLETLDLSKNKLTALPLGLRKLLRLKVLDLRENAIPAAEVDALRAKMGKDLQIFQ